MSGSRADEFVLGICLAAYEQSPLEDSTNCWIGGPVVARCGNGYRKYLKSQVAQFVEQRTENPRVVGSIPTLATISS